MPSPRLRSTYLLLFLLAACPAPRAGAPKPDRAPIRITVVGTNDLHGWVQAHEAKLESGPVLKFGGLPAFASYLGRLREENPGGVVLIDGGDLFQGTLVANLSEGAAVIGAYNALGYDASALGNHEFDYGPAGPKSAALEPGDDPFGALEARSKEARFPLLARNMYLSATGKRPDFVAPDGISIIERNGVKIGILGLITPMTPQVTNPVNVTSLRFSDLAEEALAGAAALREKGAEVLILTVHAGGRCRSLADPNSLSSCDTRGEVFQALEQLPEGLFDAVIAGHTHALIGHFVRGMPVIESNSYGTHFGVVDLVVDPATRRAVHQATKIRSAIPVCEKVFAGLAECDPRKWKPGLSLVANLFDGIQVVPDPTIERVIAPYMAKVAEGQLRPLHVKVPKTLTREYQAESPLGDALADALKAMEKTDLSLLNSGGLRADLPEGEMTYGALYEVFPFDNTIAILTLSGEEIVGMLEALLASGHGAPQTSGLRFSAERCPGKAHITDISFVDGRKLERQATYRVATSDFLAFGGDGVGVVLDKVPAERKDYGHRRALNMRDAIAAFLESRGGALTAGEGGRMILLDRKDASCPK